MEAHRVVLRRASQEPRLEAIVGAETSSVAQTGACFPKMDQSVFSGVSNRIGASFPVVKELELQGSYGLSG